MSENSASNGGRPVVRLELTGPQRPAESRLGDSPSQQTVYPDTPAPTAMPPDTGRARTHSRGR